MKTEQEYLKEAGVLYRRNTSRFPIEQDETLLYYTWHGRATGNSGRDFVVLPYAARAATDMLLRLINHWNGSLAVDWRYSTSLGQTS